MVTINKCTFLYLQILTNFGSHYPLTTTVVRVWVCKKTDKSTQPQ